MKVELGYYMFRCSFCDEKSNDPRIFINHYASIHGVPSHIINLQFTIGCVVIVLDCSANAIVEGSLSFVIDPTGRSFCVTVGITI